MVGVGGDLTVKHFFHIPSLECMGVPVTAQPVGRAGWLVVLPIAHAVLKHDLRNGTKLHKAFFFLVFSPRHLSSELMYEKSLKNQTKLTKH